jgi:FAD/FMN-containing dehydrogenase
VRYADTPAQRDRLWSARKGALAALVLIAPNYYLCDAVVPRSRLAAVLRRVTAIAEEHGVFLGTVAHVGDGNLHPTILFDRNDLEIIPRVERAHDEIIRACVDAGGTITGEHGVGLEKRKYMPWIFSDDDLEQMRRARAAFDPGGRFNPGKIFPPDDQSREPSPLGNVGVTAAVGPNTWI